MTETIRDFEAAYGLAMRILARKEGHSPRLPHMNTRKGAAAPGGSSESQHRREVIWDMCEQGFRTKKIAEVLSLHPQTVEYHVRAWRLANDQARFNGARAGE